jgi:Tol biopolymer transport system component
VALSPGIRLGFYDIISRLGAGGMGEVYRARDTKLGRDVALKILPDTFTHDPERLARFRREAQVLASLDHPHIGAIYGLDEANSQQFLVLELVDGESLDRRIARGPIPVDEALVIAKQIAEALEAAHERGIIHRDLKPANIALTRDGSVKVLDFGLAKATEPGSGPSLEVTNSPTITTPAMMTGIGVILGTAAYMSPEKAKGRPADKRSDIWAFGCVLYEMLVGTRPFAAEDVTGTMAAILERAPVWSALPRHTLPAVRRLLERCLSKNPHRRLHDIADARIEIEDALTTPALAADEARTAGSRLRIAMVAIPAAVAGAVIAASVITLRSVAPIPKTITRLQVALGQPIESGGGVVALSPDGRRIVYSTGVPGYDQLFVRDVDEFESRPITGSERAVTATFSPDGQWIAFVADRKLKKVALSGGAPRTVHETVDEPGLSWTSEQSILFNPGTATGIWRVSADGGEAQALTTSGAHDNMHRFPELLPNGKGVLYAAQGGVSDDQVFVQSLSTHQSRLLTKGSAPYYLPTGHLVYVDAGTLYAVRFDQDRMETIGSPKAVVEGIRQTASGASPIGFSQAGTTVYVAAAGGPRTNELVWVDGGGHEQLTGASGKPYAQPRLSPDGRYVVTSLRGDAEDLWIYDLTRGASSRLTSKGSSSFPVWSPDGRRLALSVGRNDIYIRLHDGTAPDQRLVTGTVPNYPFSWSPDGRTLAYVSVNATTLQDIWVVTLDDRKTRPVFASPFREGAPVFSPDGRWMAYVSDESGRNEIYVTPFPGPGEKAAVSTDGGSEPVWPRGGKTLFYRNSDEMMAVEIATSPALSVGKARVMFRKPYERSIALWPNYDATPDGLRLLMVKGNDASPAPSFLNVVLNWAQELK